MVHDPPTPQRTEPRRTLRSPAPLAVGLLGVNAWLVVYLIPTLHLGLSTDLGSAASVLPLGVLLVGVASLATRRELARWCLLAVYPPALGATIALQPALVDREIVDMWVILVAAGSLVAYVAAAGHACARPPSEKESSSHPVTSKDPLVEPPSRRWLRRGLLGIAGLGGFAIVGVAPIWTSRAARAERWGEAADDGAVLTIVVASVVAAIALGAIVGPALRAERRAALTPKKRRRRVALALLVATAAGVGWLVLTHLDRAS